MTEEDEYRFRVENEFIAKACAKPRLYRAMQRDLKLVIARADACAEFMRGFLGHEASLDQVVERLNALT